MRAGLHGVASAVIYRDTDKQEDSSVDQNVEINIYNKAAHFWARVSGRGSCSSIAVDRLVVALELLQAVLQSL